MIPVPGGRGGGERVQRHGRGQHEAVVVVGVVAHDLRAPGGGEERGRFALAAEVLRIGAQQRLVAVGLFGGRALRPSVEQVEFPLCRLGAQACGDGALVKHVHASVSFRACGRGDVFLPLL